MKTTGALWNAYLDSWPKGQWFDDSNETINGISAEDYDERHGIPDDDAVVEFTCGVVYENDEDREGKDLVRHFQAWKRAQTMVTLVIDIPKAEEALLRAAVKTWKGLVRS